MAHLLQQKALSFEAVLGAAQLLLHLTHPGGAHLLGAPLCLQSALQLCHLLCQGLQSLCTLAAGPNQGSLGLHCQILPQPLAAYTQTSLAWCRLQGVR